MNYAVKDLQKKWQQSIVHQVFDWKDERGRGRFCVMMSGLLSSMVGQMVNGLFLTSFLLLYGMDKSEIGILTFIPYLASLLNVFSPTLLERFQKRRGLLIGMRLFYYLVNILGITILPTVVKDSEARILGFVVLVFLANAVNQLASSGWTVWTAEFLPEEIRVDYFQVTTCIQNAFIWVFALGISFLGDRVSGTEHELILLTVVRYSALILAALDCLIWLIPKEYPYASRERIKLSNIFLLPMRQKKFLITSLLVAGYYFSASFASGTLTAYLLQDVGVSYSLVNGINAVYFAFFFFLSGFWKKFVVKHYWYKAMAYEICIEAFSFLLYAFVTKNTIWLYVVVRLIQHVMGVLTSSVLNSLVYVALPKEDSTNYLSFYTIVVNGSIFISMMIGTAFCAAMGNRTVLLGGLEFTGTQLCLLATCVAEGLLAFWVFKLAPSLTPEWYHNDKKEAV